MIMMRFILRRRLTLRGRRWFWHLKAANHEIIAQGHTRGYSREIDAEHAIELVQGSAIAVTERKR
jgi:uncharacterized protein YegP (UPF0339 family)